MSALHRVLADFGPDRQPSRRPPWPLLLDPPPAPDEPEPAAPVVDRVADAVATALAEAECAHAKALSDLAERHAADLARSRAAWATEEGTALAESLRRTGAAIEEALAEAAAAALEPLLDAAARVLAVDGLRAAVAELVSAGTGGRIAVSGPADLIAALRLALPAAGIDPAGLDFTPSEAAEMSIVADDSAVETRLAAWAGAVRLHLCGARADAAAGGDRP